MRISNLPNDVDLAFNTIHGTFGEDGHLQKILEGRGIAYTGEGVVASEIAFDKIRTKEKFQEHGVTTPPSEVIHAGTASDDSIADCRQGATTRLNRRRRHCEERKRSRIRHRRSVEIWSRIINRKICSRAGIDNRRPR
jgi:hypothetical protein